MRLNSRRYFRERKGRGIEHIMMWNNRRNWIRLFSLEVQHSLYMFFSRTNPIPFLFPLQTSHRGVHEFRLLNYTQMILY